ncbi:antibiotic biosynthesis monooxygenase family protein [Levilactobacillus huananensis]|uniref:monooxygenase n=1 Tax=Levilactobacillus huananensis TaxID=2486019 RepID=UPI000F785FE0|nr:monooxygenase [Levilactobacillus huananensis]
MLTQLAVTFGSRYLLEQLISKHPDRSFVLLADTTDPAGLQLVDVSDHPTIFSSRLSYRVLFSHGETDWQGFYHFLYFTFDPDDAKIFEDHLDRLVRETLPVSMQAILVLQKDRIAGEYVVLTIWDDSLGYALWRHSYRFHAISKFTQRAVSSHAATYRIAPPEEDDDDTDEQPPVTP